MKTGQNDVAGKKADVMRDVEQFKRLDAEIDEALKKYNSLVDNPQSVADLHAAGTALEKIKSNQRQMQGISRSFANKGRAWLKARRLDEALFKETLEVPQLTIDINAEQNKLAQIIARYR